MVMRGFEGIAMELALQASGHRFPRLSHVGSAWGTDAGPPTEVSLHPPYEEPQSIDVATDGYAIFILDVTWTPDGQVHLIEANGSNAALTSAVLGKDDRRARHMCLSYKSKKKPAGKVAAVLAYQAGLLHVAEFFGRAGIFAALVTETQTVRLCDTDERLGDEEVSVICGSITAIADHVDVKGRQLFFKGRPVAFATNPNLLAELVRRKIVNSAAGDYDVDYTVYHEGCCTPLIHDKGAQQDIADGTGITPLYHVAAHSFDECITVIRDFHRKGLVAVGKMNAGSGGAGIEFFPPSLSEHEIRERLGGLINSAVQKYGSGVLNSMFPIRFFQFARSTDYVLYDEAHLWDLRMQCLVYPGYVEVTPCIIRLCPEPFDEKSYSRPGVVSNLTGTDPDTMARRLRSPAAMRRSRPGESVLGSIGIDRERATRIKEACARWCERAWAYSRERASALPKHREDA